MIWLGSSTSLKKLRYIASIGFADGHVNDRRFASGRQIVADFVNLRADLGERGVGIVIQPQMDGDDADALEAARFHVVDAIGAGDLLFERRGDEALDQFGVGADVNRGDGDYGALAFGILPNVEVVQRADADQQDQQVDHHRQDRPFDEDVGETHGLAGAIRPGVRPTAG